MVSSSDFDESAFSAIKLMMKERFPVLAEKFTRNASLYVQKADEALRAGDLEKMVENVHALKSSSAMMGFNGFHHCAVRIEEKARNGNIDLEEDMARLRAYLQHSVGILAPYVAGKT